MTELADPSNARRGDAAWRAACYDARVPDARKRKVIVVGSGPAGLSAGVRLLEASGGDLDVELVTLGHHFGGKAATWRDHEGFTIEHGFHAVFGFYEEMRSLAKRAGVDLGAALHSSAGRWHYFDQRTHDVKRLDLHPSPVVTLLRLSALFDLGPADNRAMTDAGMRTFRALTRPERGELLDDVCYRAFLLEHGMPPSVLRHPMYRQTQEVLFNYPYEVSAYVLLKGLSLLMHCVHDATFHYSRGGLSEMFWDPIARYFERLGGRIRIRQKLVRLEHEDGALRGLVFAAPDASSHDEGRNPWPPTVPTVPGSEIRDAPDAVICTLPVANFVELNPGDAMWSDPYFANMRNLRSVSTVSLQVWQKEALRAPVEGTISGLALPFGYAIDTKRLGPAYGSDDPRFGASLMWAGQEGGFEDVPDEKLIADARAALGAVPGYEGSEQAEVVHRHFRRNRANHQRYLLTEPGTLRFRPHMQSPLRGLWLAGDWVRNEIDVPTMEGAIRCGKAAADAVVEALA